VKVYAYQIRDLGAVAISTDFNQLCGLAIEHAAARYGVNFSVQRHDDRLLITEGQPIGPEGDIIVQEYELDDVEELKIMITVDRRVYA
jgi:hypothetical protein